MSPPPPGAPATRARWWELFADPVLDGLMGRLEEANPNVAAAAARAEQADAFFRVTRTNLSPTIRADAGAGRRRDSVNNLVFPVTVREYERYQIGLTSSWELDLWGQVRATVKRDALRAEAASALHADLLLSLRADLAEQYFAHRAAREEIALLDASRRRWDENLALEESRLKFGDGVAGDVARARLQLQGSIAAGETARRAAGKLHHAIAILTGALPAELDPGDLASAAAAATTNSPAPDVPAGLPSDLLLRRPDVLAAERELRAAALGVGIRSVDFLPRFTLSGAAGYSSLETGNLASPDSVFFDLGPQVDIPVFRGGLRGVAVEQARAGWREAAANYRATFLNAVREVDDALLDARSFAREHSAQEAAVRAATEAANQAKDRHAAGLSSYFEYIAAEQDRLQASLRENALRHQRHRAAVRLIRALGGSWAAAHW